MATVPGSRGYVDIVLTHRCGHQATHAVGRRYLARATEILTQLDCETCGMRRLLRPGDAGMPADADSLRPARRGRRRLQ